MFREHTRRSNFLMFAIYKNTGKYHNTPLAIRLEV
jgi:hypothetical protein